MRTSYNAKDCTVLLDNVFITGLGEDAVTGEKDEEMFTTSVGVQGDVVENEVNNPLGTITVAVQATSPQKGMLINYAKSGRHFPLWITNKSIGERIGGTDCRIKSFPELENGAEAADRSFEIQVFDYTVEAI